MVDQYQLVRHTASGYNLQEFANLIQGAIIRNKMEEDYFPIRTHPKGVLFNLYLSDLPKIARKLHYVNNLMFT